MPEVGTVPFMTFVARRERGIVTVADDALC